MLHLWIVYLERWVSKGGHFPLVEDAASERDRFRVVAADSDLYVDDNQPRTHLSVKTSNLLQSDRSHTIHLRLAAI